MFLFKFVWKFTSFLLLVAFVIPTWAIGKIWYTAQNETIGKADAIVVMGAAQLDGRPGEVLEARLKETLRIYEKGFAKKIYTLGTGAPGDRFTEAAASRSYLISRGIKATSITAVSKGRDTYRSIEALSKGVGVKSIKEVIIVTDPYHCLRSMTMANDFGFNATCSPVRAGIASLEEAGFRYLLRESGAYLAYLTLGRRGIHISDHVA
ncbi:MAG: YdcF family protein [Actinobacteria bacterium]|nr:YdcF family protein [Actinomycetota bacterium]